MKKKFRQVLGLFITAVFIFGSVSVFAEGEDAEERAKQTHQLAASDVIYSQEETKALYYQNLQIIDLLKQIRDLLDQRLQQSKDSKN